MAIPPLPVHSPSGRPSAWQRWVLNVLYSFDRHVIDDWVGLLTDHLQRRDGATAMRTAGYAVDVIRNLHALKSATGRLASHGHPAARYLFADAALDLNDSLDTLCKARDELLKVAGADGVAHTD
jgi:hypothetical protein